MNRKAYWCPKCGAMITGIIAFRKHEGSKACEKKRTRDERVLAKREAELKK